MHHGNLIGQVSLSDPDIDFWFSQWHEFQQGLWPINGGVKGPSNALVGLDDSWIL
jgi:hypothetical protein